jgi:hypothetical protein
MAAIAEVRPSEMAAFGMDWICNDEKRNSNNTVAPSQNTMRAKTTCMPALDDLSAHSANTTNSYCHWSGVIAR